MTRPTIRLGDPLLRALSALLVDHGGAWEGEPADLLAALRHRTPVGDRPLPGDAGTLSALLRRRGALLEKAGFDITRRKSRGRRIVMVRWLGVAAEDAPNVAVSFPDVIEDVRPMLGPPPPTAEQERAHAAMLARAAYDAWPRRKLFCPRCGVWTNDRNRVNNRMAIDPSWDGVHDLDDCDLELRGGAGRLMVELHAASEAAARQQFERDQAARRALRESAALVVPAPLEAELRKVVF